MDKSFQEDAIYDSDLDSENKSLEDGELSDDNYFIIEPDKFIQPVNVESLEDDLDEVLSDEPSESEEFTMVPGLDILESMLAAPRKESHKSKTSRGRIVDRENAELEFLLPNDLADQLSRIQIKNDEPLETCGTMILRIEDTQTITFKSTKMDGVMDIGTAIFNSSRKIIGIIGYIFGTADEMNYQVMCSDVETCEALHPGDVLLCAPGATGAFFAAPEADTTPVNCDSDEFFSDDEKESANTRQKNGPKKAKKRNNKQSASASVNTNPFVVPPMRATYNHRGHLLPQRPNYRGQQPPHSFANQMPPVFTNYRQPPPTQTPLQILLQQPPPPFFPYANLPPPPSPSNVAPWTPQWTYHR